MQRLTFKPGDFFSRGGPGLLGRRGLASWGAALALGAVSACGTAETTPPSVGSPNPALKRAAEWTIVSEPTTPRPPFTFSPDDDRFLEEVERASFWYLWSVCDPESGMVYDRSGVKFASTAGVGFQLAAIPAAVERGWVTREAGRDRAMRILRTLESNPDSRKAGLFYHFLDGRTAAPIDNDVVSTVDSALLFAGMIVAGEYFGGEIAERSDRLFSQADWSFFVLRSPKPDEDYLRGYVSLGWKPRAFARPTGAGDLLSYAWADAGDEQRLVSFLAAAASEASHRVDPAVYYRLRRMLGEYRTSGVHIWFPWSGALFTHFFAQCFLNYSGMGPDDPGAHGGDRRPRVDWWENARRAVALHRLKALENPAGLPGLGVDAWGFSASDCPTGYAVPGVFPNRVTTSDQIPQVDFADFVPKDDFGDGTIAPYAAGCSVMFEPAAAIATLRSYRARTIGQEKAAVWRDAGRTGETGGYGFQDSFCIRANWVAPDCVAIDQGPLVLAIENARSGLIWRLFHQSSQVRAAMKRLGLSLKIRGGVR